MPTKRDLREFINETKDLPKELFVEQFPYPALTLEGNASEEGLDREKLVLARTEALEMPTVDGPNIVQYIVFLDSDGSVSMGRSRDRDIVLDHALISKRHAFIKKIDNGAILVDDGSTNGTDINGIPANPGEPMDLKTGDTIVLGGAFRGKFHDPRNLYDYLKSI